MRERSDFWDDIDQWSEGARRIVENTDLYELQANEFIAEISDHLVRWWLLQLFDEETRETHEVAATKKTMVDGDEMWHLKMREHERTGA